MPLQAWGSSSHNRPLQALYTQLQTTPLQHPTLFKLVGLPLSFHALGTLTLNPKRQEFVDHLDHPVVKRYLGLLDLHVGDVEDLFHILDDGDAWRPHGAV